MELYIFHYFAILNHSIGEFLQSVSIFCVKISKEDAAIFWNLIILNVFPNSSFFRYIIKFFLSFYY